MKKPTKQQRHAIYKKALKSLKDDYSEGLCVILDDCGGYKYDDGTGFGPFAHIHDNFPELMMQRPHGAGNYYWWSLTKRGVQARRRALLRCIELTA